jgi:hypothetical protein
MKRNWFRASLFQTRRREPRKGRLIAWSVPVEALEGRKLLAYMGPTYTDVSQIAALTPPHAGFTNLYINFDGGDVPLNPAGIFGEGTATIAPFETAEGDGSLNRDRDIQDILYEVSEVYAPFNVSVHRIYGAGKYGTGQGDTTVFVGGNDGDATIMRSGGKFLFTKYSYSFTPSASADYPRPGHTINSDSYDVAFVDPVVGSSTNPATYDLSEHTEFGSDSSHANTFDIVRSIAHEAGHTFGLSHVRTDGLTDPTPLAPGTVPDVMSYDSRNQFFADQNLTLTSANNNGTSTTFDGTVPSYETIDRPGLPRLAVVPFQTQNSYLTLGDVLGVRAAEQYATVANPTAVDPAYSHQGGAAPEGNLNKSPSLGGLILRPGDSQVFTITTPTSNYYYETITAQALSTTLRPELLVYDASGETILNYADPSAAGNASLSLQNGKTYQVVVTSQDENSAGFFSIKVGYSTIGRLTATTTSTTTTTLKSPVSANVAAIVAPTNAGPTGLGATDFVPLTISIPEVNFITSPVPQGTKSKTELI